VRFVPGESLGDTEGFKGARRGRYASALVYERQPDRSYKLIAEVTLPHPVAPVSALVADDGHFVTFDNWHNLGGGKAVAVHDPAGRLVRAWALGEIYPAGMLERVPRSVSSRHWRCHPIHFVEPAAQKSVYVPEALGGYFVVTLATGGVAYHSGQQKECAPHAGPLSLTTVPR
jgi:hypothetical protein